MNTGETRNNYRRATLKRLYNIERAYVYLNYPLIKGNNAWHTQLAANIVRVCEYQISSSPKMIEQLGQKLSLPMD